ncbi:hypothetical protein BD410DRAFT_797098 [Rickenella mellea]|uniref:Uncharacterized protein n=1 Tax=Rickenella mellea TaxID=50990 RepID=A0A4Y7PHR2_9AGAM|nr:hypothetical protein BD410DRAFT_797098 [Rickenella mellea]
MKADKYYYSDPHDVRNCVTQQTVLSTIHRWRELYLGDNFHQDYCDNLNHSVTGLPALTHLSVCHGTISHNSEPLPTWWGVFVERFGRVGSSSPVLRSADVPLGYLTTSGGLFSNVTRLRIYLPTNQSPAKISSALLYMHHLIILELQFRFFNEAIDATEDMKVCKLQFKTSRGSSTCH